MTELRWFFSFHGRIGRRVFIFGILIVQALLSAIGWALVFIIRRVNAPREELFNFLLFLTVIAVFSSCGLVVRRLHDMGPSGIWALGVAFVVFLCKYIGFMLIPSNAALLQVTSWIILFVFFAVLLLYPGEEKDNAYGPAHAR
jgi:uncharacterized membrane protein YhaH (DUF805 family)